MVDIEPLQAFPNPVTLAQIKEEPSLQDLALIRQSRLSVMPIPADAWRLICTMGGIDAV